MDMSSKASRRSSAGFTLIEILVVVVIIGIMAAGVLLSVSLTGRDRELEKESDRLLGLVNYAREQAELQTREYGLLVSEDAYQFVAYDVHRGLWREVYEDDALRLRKLPYGLDFKLSVETRPVVLLPLSDVGPKPAGKPDVKTQKDLPGLKDASSLQGAASLQEAATRLKEAAARNSAAQDSSSGLKEAKTITPQVMIYSNGDLTSFEITLQREGGVHSVTLSQDEKGQFVAKPMVENRT